MSPSADGVPAPICAALLNFCSTPLPSAALCPFTLICSHRTYDRSTALTLLLSASYSALPTLYAEISARIITETVHGLFHAALPFAAYEELARGAWRAGGCTCRPHPRVHPARRRQGRRPRAQSRHALAGFLLGTTIPRWVCGDPERGR
ncbi:hypothetical protein R3P38DRAFT_3260990 [Favolaschia claudopus]|uniref:Uncharacterized protein n=1 Tax=Favolaschia claudopus TaxID=2862362 RepID=A0AAW0CNM5_9AGAR